MSESTQTSNKKKNTGLYWLFTLVSTIATIAMLMFASEWFWLGLPFALTSVVLATDAI